MQFLRLEGGTPTCMFLRARRLPKLIIWPLLQQNACLLWTGSIFDMALRVCPPVHHLYKITFYMFSGVSLELQSRRRGSQHRWCLASGALRHRLEPRQRPASYGTRVARRAEKNCLYLQISHRGGRFDPASLDL